MRTARIATAHARRIAAFGPRSARPMTTEAAGGGGGGGGGFGMGFVLGAAVGGAGYYAYANGLIDMSLTGTTERKPAVDYAKVREDIAAIMEENADMGPTLVRLAWHSAGTYDKETDTGGSNGATMRFQPEADHGANAGLHLARGVLETVKAKNPGISHADLYTLAGVVAVEEMGGPEIPWRPGRTDAATGDACPPDGRLPDAAQGENHIRNIFGRMGFTDREMVALSGAHSLGRCHTDRSGYDGPWTRAPTTFSNLYFTELRDTKWRKRKWDGPEQYENPEKDLMMLPTDIALWTDKTFRQYVLKYAEDEEAFFADFAAAFSKLLELGVKFPEDQKQQSA